MSILQALCFDNLKSLGGVSLPTNFGMLRTGGVYYSSSAYTAPPKIDAGGWLCASDASGVQELRGQYFEPFVPDKTKVYWLGARFRNINNQGFAPFRLGYADNNLLLAEPLLTNHASLALASGTGTAEVFLEVELNYPNNAIRYFKDGVQVFLGNFQSMFSALYSAWAGGTRIVPGLLFKNQTAWSAGGADQYKVRDFSIVVDDGVGITSRMGPVNIRRAPILVSAVAGANKDVPTSQTILNQELTNTYGTLWTKAAGAVKLTAATSSVNFKLDLTGITGRKLAAGIIVGAQRASGTVIPVVELSQVVNGTTLKDTAILPMANISQDYVNWTNPRSEFAAANVDLATVDFSLTLKDPA